MNFARTDIALPGQPYSVTLGDMDGVNGKDIVFALWQTGTVGVMLNQGDGTFGPLKQYSAGSKCLGLAVEIELGDVTSPAGFFVQDGKLDAYVTCTPYVVRLTGDGTGALGSPLAIQMYLPPYAGAPTIDYLAMTRRPDGNPAPLLALQRTDAVGRKLCVSYELDAEQLVCSPTPAGGGPMAVGDLNGAFPGVPPDEIFTGAAGNQLGVFGFAPQLPTYWSDGERTVPGGVESVALGDLDGDGRLDVLVGQIVNSAGARVDSIHFFLMGPIELAQVATPLPSTPGLDAVAIADVDGDGRNDVIGAGGDGRGMLHLGTGAGTFDGGHDLPQVGYGNPATSTRVAMAVGDLNCDGRPEIVISDVVNQAVMVYRNASTPAGATCSAPPQAVPVVTNPPAVIVPTPVPTPVTPRTCANPGSTRYTVGTPGDDVLVGGTGRDVLSGRGGDDCLFGFSGEDRLTGGTGKDLLVGSSGDDRLLGDAGDDKINAGNGNDDITPGAGKDVANGQGGDDTISARDGTRDTIDCGAGRDKVIADRTDAVKNCEFVKRAKRRG